MQIIVFYSVGRHLIFSLHVCPVINTMMGHANGQLNGFH